MAASFEDLNKTVTDMRNDLNCQICGNTPRPGKTQWFRCLKLHQICQDCQSKNEKCSCGEPISKEHCKIIEKLLSTKRMKLNCKNTKNGCREVLADFALKDHESECFYREIPLYDGGKAIFKNFVGEVIPKYPEVKHPISRNQGSQPYTEANDSYKTILRFQFGMKTFISLHYLWSPLTIYAVVYIVGSPEEAKHFSFTLKYFGQKSYITFGGQVMSVDETIDSVMKTKGMDGKVFHTDRRYFEKMFVNKDGKFEYSLEVKNLKEEAKDDNYESGISDDDQETKK